MSEILKQANELVAAEVARLEFYEGCIVAHTLDQLCERALQMIEKRMPMTEVSKVTEKIEAWTNFGHDSAEGLANFGTGKDEEHEWELSEAKKKRERLERRERRQFRDNEHSNNLDDGYEL